MAARRLSDGIPCETARLQVRFTSGGVPLGKALEVIGSLKDPVSGTLYLQVRVVTVAAIASYVLFVVREGLC